MTVRDMTYNSIPVAEIPFQITEEDRKKVAELKDPDDLPEAKVCYQHDFRTRNKS